MEMFDEEFEKVEDVGEVGGKEKKKRFNLSTLTVNPYILVGVGVIVLVLLLFALAGRKNVIKQQGDIGIINKVIEEQLKAQRKMNKALMDEIKALRKELESIKRDEGTGVEKIPEKKGKRTDLLDLIRTKRREVKKEQSREEKLRKLEKKLRELELERRKRKVPPRELRMEFYEREVKANFKKKSSVAKKRKKKVFIPAGTVMRGRIVSGFFAPVGTGVKFPSVLIELRGSASTPNNFRIPLDKCRVIAKAEGDWVLERAKLQTYKLACVLPNGKVIETRFNARVTSRVDGMEGVRGKFVNASAKQLRTFFATTFLGTLFESLARAQVRTDIAVEGGAVFKSETIKNEAEYAFYRSLADTWRQFSQFYLEQAKKALPVVLVEGNVPVYLEVIDGFSLEVSPDEMVANRS